MRDEVNIHIGEKLFGLTQIYGLKLIQHSRVALAKPQVRLVYILSRNDTLSGFNVLKFKETTVNSL